MVLGRTQVNPATSTVRTGLADVDPKHVRDVDADTVAAVQEKIDAYEGAGLTVPKALRDMLKVPKAAKAAPAEEVPKSDDGGSTPSVKLPQLPPQPQAGQPVLPDKAAEKARLAHEADVAKAAAEQFDDGDKEEDEDTAKKAAPKPKPVYGATNPPKQPARGR